MSGQKLPHSILPTYLSYKAGTAAIVTWLKSNATSTTTASGAAMTLASLSKLADNVKARGVPLTDKIATTFTDTILARKTLTKFFEGAEEQDEASNSRHRAFTSTLEQMFEKLRPSRTSNVQPKAPKKEPATSSGVEVSEASLANRFERLLTLGDESAPGTTEVASSVPEKLWQDRKPAIRDDEMAKALELSKILNDLDMAMGTVAEMWNWAAEGRTSFGAVAAFSAAVYILVLESLKDFEDLQKASKIEAAISTLQTVRKSTASSDDGSSTAPMISSSAIISYLMVALEAVRAFNNNNRATAAALRVKKLELFNPDEFMEEDEDWASRYLRILLQNNLERPEEQLLLSHMSTTSNMWLSRQPTKQIDWTKIFGLALLAVAHRAYHVPVNAQSVTDRPSKLPNLRLEVLRFAGEVTTSVRAVLQTAQGLHSREIPMQATLVEILTRRLAEIEATTKINRFDGYSQNPFIAGTHMGAMLHFVQQWTITATMHLPSVLHAYNLLVQLGDIPRHSLFEKLCDLYEDSIFNGGRPSKNYDTSFARFNGGRIAFDRDSGRTSGGTYGSNPVWRLRMPTDSEATNTAISQYNKGPSTLFGSIFDDVMRVGDPDLYKHIYKKARDAGKLANKKGTADSQELISVLEMKISSVRWALLTDIEEAVGATAAQQERTTGGRLTKQDPEDNMRHLPTLTLNHPAIWCASVEVFGSVLDSTTHQAKHPQRIGLDCLCILTRFLEYADKLNNGETTGLVYGAALRREWRLAITRMMERPLSKFQWQAWK